MSNETRAAIAARHERQRIAREPVPKPKPAPKPKPIPTVED